MNEPAENEAARQEEENREVRIALVLYGGVSLAVYENGVTRTFFDLVRAKGVFKLLLAMLDARAVVDVVAGASAGGINGLLLAAALEAGADFSSCATIWRKHGDFGKLLRPVAEANKAVSLLQGETYYQEKLTSAFSELLSTGSSKPATASEMDVFITGTDFEGLTRTYTDDLGQAIKDKDYRTVFHLKHRPGRRCLGLSSEESKDPAPHRNRQAVILASLARLTSSFPAAFPPFQVDQVPTAYQEAVRTALAQCAVREGSYDEGQGDRAYIDGGVLDNKPFGPVLTAIFHRMPLGVVDRRLFYVEPDPEHFSRINSATQAREYSPLGVAIAALSTIPSHESINGDLDELKRHNARTKWLAELQEAALERLAGPIPAPARTDEQQLYHRCRIECLARSLLMEGEDTPSAETAIPPDRQELFKALKTKLEKLPTAPVAEFDRFDIDFHLRTVFRLLNLIYERHEKDPTEKIWREAMQATGRLIKLLKVVRSAMLVLRQEAVPGCLTMGSATKEWEKAADILLARFNLLLDGQARPWAAITQGIEQPGPEETIMAMASRQKGPLGSSLLSDASRTAWESAIELAELKPEDLRTRNTSGRTILETIATATDSIMTACAHADPVLDFARLRPLDAILFPMHFTSGIYELDPVEFVRISPSDAQIGLSRLAASDKVTGDELAHFAAFLRRDWRSNDILWGRLDAICQIICSLLNKGAKARIRAKTGALGQQFTAANLKDSYLRNCPAQYLQELETAWQDFAASPIDSPQEAGAYACLKEKLVLAAQHDAAFQDLPGLYQDMNFQEIAWGRLEGAGGVNSSSHETQVEDAAAAKAEETIGRADKVTTRGEAFRDLRMGGQTVVGPTANVPPNILGEYATHAYLIFWGMLGRALGGKAGKPTLLDKRSVRALLHHPVLFSHVVITTMRTQQNLAPLLLAMSASALATAAIIGFLYGESWAWLAIAMLVLLFILVQRASPPVFVKRRHRFLRLLQLFCAIAAGAGLGVWFYKHGRSWFG